MNPDAVAAIVLAGGQSRRMRREKFLLLDNNGRPLIETIIAQLRPCFTGIMISAGDKDKFSFLNLPVIVDEAPGRGPLLAILSALRASLQAGNFIMACDIPVIHIPFIQKILARSRRYEIVVPRYKDGKFEPLFAFYHCSIIAAIERQIGTGDLRISSLFRTCRTGFVPMDGQKWFRNLNTMEEYHAYLQSEKKSGS
ncbi:MAG: molybdenum cofactor guanylyltransferase [Candidatus Aminicenantes bacterium]|nr:molybdenum cofactor guanylyltransferase [Acidobacteriota bacterium]MCG2809906.1 molybdenum cofactor guanylyltransferase [Candidatus Aminicenantes bacterium]